MPDEPRVQELLDELLDSGATPEEVCRTCPEFLPVVRVRWRQICWARDELDALLPVSSHDQSSANPSEDRPLPRVPGYEIGAVLGHGGMGIVFQAKQLRLGRFVALKMTLAGTYAGPRDRERFRREAEALAAVQHANIVQIHDVGECAGLPYLAMEFVGGGNLARRLGGIPLPAREAASLLAILAEATHAAHRGGIVHRDLKPSNILFTPEGTPKVTDFGLAKRLKGDASLTLSGVSLGTPSYMAPEQAEGKIKDVGPLADVYALGAILYECLTGRPPFRAESAAATLQQVVTDEPVAPRRLNPSVPRDLETICMKCLNKVSTRRYASAEELANDLERFKAGEPIRARPVGAVERSWKWAQRRPTLAALLGVLLFAMIGLTALSAIALDREKKARREAIKAKKARDFLISIFRIKDTHTGNTTTARQILNQAEERIPVEFADQRELRDELLAVIEDVNRSLAPAIPAAMILQTQGAITLHSQRGDTDRPGPQMLLYPDDRLTLAADARMQLVFLSDLRKGWLQPGRDVTIGRKDCSPGDAVRKCDDSILMTFVRLPKGTFYMGWDGKPDSAKKTEIKEDFEVAVHPVTQGQWEAIMGNNPSWFSRKGLGRTSVLEISDEELKLFPVESVSWDDTQEFLKKLNEKERGRDYWYRLPTEAEWEYACRGGATSLEECSHHFYFDKPTNDLSSEQSNFDGNRPFGNAPKGPYRRRPTRVGAYPSNKLGLCDRHGNIYQWTDTAQGSFRVFRGGGWSDDGAGCRAADHNWDLPSFRFNVLGLLLARVPRPVADQAGKSGPNQSP
ncbi:bifunctional serine/threonine-protein kinase/formylglycine-generating enzyme family protein [Singulisphaera rosea]